MEITLRKKQYSEKGIEEDTFFQENVLVISSGVFIVNSEHISHLARREKCQNTCFILEKRKKSKFNRLQIEVILLFLPNISPLPNPEYRPIKFVLCLYIRPGCINGILRQFLCQLTCSLNCQNCLSFSICLKKFIFPWRKYANLKYFFLKTKM